MESKNNNDLEKRFSILSAPNFNLRMILKPALEGFQLTKQIADNKIEKFSNSYIYSKSHSIISVNNDFSIYKSPLFIPTKSKFNKLSMDKPVRSAAKNKSNKTTSKDDYFTFNNDDLIIAKKTSLSNDIFSLNSSHKDRGRTEISVLNNNNKHPNFKDIVTKGPKNFREFACYGKQKSIHESMKIRHLEKIKLTLFRERTKLRKMNYKAKDDLSNINKLCTITAAEKIELIEDCEQLDIDLCQLYKQKLELYDYKTNIQTTNAVSTVNNDNIISNTNETLESNIHDTQTTQKTYKSSKYKHNEKKIQDLRNNFVKLQKMLEHAKIKSKEKEDNDKHILEEITKFLIEIDYKKRLLFELKESIELIKINIEHNNCDKKQNKKLSSGKIFGTIKNIFSAKNKKSINPNE
jgi:hypothetical protein